MSIVNEKATLLFTRQVNGASRHQRYLCKRSVREQAVPSPLPPFCLPKKEEKRSPRTIHSPALFSCVRARRGEVYFGFGPVRFGGAWRLWRRRGGDGSRSTDGNGEPNFGVHAPRELVKAQGAFEIARKHMCFLFCFAVFPTISRI